MKGRLDRSMTEVVTAFFQINLRGSTRWQQFPKIGAAHNEPSDDAGIKKQRDLQGVGKPRQHPSSKRPWERSTRQVAAPALATRFRNDLTCSMVPSFKQ